MGIRLLIILAIMTLAEYYSFIVIRSAVRKFPRAWRAGTIAFYVFISCFIWVGLLSFRQIDWTVLPLFVRNLYIAFTMGFVVGKLVILIFVAIDDIRRSIAWLLHLVRKKPTEPEEIPKSNGIPRSIFLSRIALLAGGLMLSAFMYGTKNRYNYKVFRHRIKIDGLPEAFRGLKIVQLSDIHSGSLDNARAVERGIMLALEQKPDLILVTGDLVNHRTEEAEPFKHIYSKLRAPLGVYSILGNHDYGDYSNWESEEAKAENMQYMIRLQKEMGWRLLLNEHVVLEKDGQSLAIIGVENWGAHAGFPKYGKLDKAIEGLEEKNVPVQILLSHDPSHWDAEVLQKHPEIQLTLSGHTHGMQFGVETPAFQWSPAKYVYRNWAGLYEEHKQYLYVNRGFGYIGYPGRLGILPEITVLELV